MRFVWFIIFILFLSESWGWFTSIASRSMESSIPEELEQQDPAGTLPVPSEEKGRELLLSELLILVKIEAVRPINELCSADTSQHNCPRGNGAFKRMDLKYIWAPESRDTKFQTPLRAHTTSDNEHLLAEREEKEHFRQIEITLEGNSCLRLPFTSSAASKVSWPHPDAFRALSFLPNKYKVFPSSLRPLREKEKRKKAAL